MYFIRLLPYMMISILLGLSNIAHTQDTFTKSQLLSTVDSNTASDKKVNSERESRFRSERDKQKKRLNSVRKERKKEESLSAKLEEEFDKNEKDIKELTNQIEKELGDLKELFGVIQQAASDAQEKYKRSIISSQFPERATQLQQMVTKMGSTTDLISIEEIEQMWYHLNNEMIQQGKVVTFDATVAYPSDDNGELIYEEKTLPVTRVGVFNLLSDDNVLLYKEGIGLTALDRKMDKAYIAASGELQNPTESLIPFFIDPTRGSLLNALVKRPSILEKLEDGKVIGYIIMGLGCIALLMALIKILAIKIVESKVKRQIKTLDTPRKSNPLGRLLLIANNNPEIESESMELKLGDAVLKESPRLHSGLMLLKMIAVVAPLLGLLGTVTGMIQTFQSITLYGAGDPQLMAGGISQALVTTVLGLVVAIPIVLLHTSAANRAKQIEGVLEEHAAALMAKHIDVNKK